MFPKKKKSSETEEQLQQDKLLIAKIQPQGSITFGDEKLIKTGDGYEIILYIYQYPKYIDKFWLTQIVNIDNVVVTIDIETKDQQKVKQNINNSMSKQRTRIMYAKDMQERIEAEDEFADLEVSRMNQVMKLIHVRLFVSGRTIAEVENNTKEIWLSKILSRTMAISSTGIPRLSLMAYHQHFNHSNAYCHLYIFFGAVFRAGELS